MIVQIAIGNGDLYTWARARDNIMVSLKIASPFYGRIVIGKLSGAAVLRELSPIFMIGRLISLLWLRMMDFVGIFSFADYDCCWNVKHFQRKK